MVGFGIGGDERRAGPGLFTEVYAKARAHGLHVTCHAGETAGPESIAALWTRSKPSASATRSPWLTIPRCWNAACARQVPLEICLSSDLRTGCCGDLAAHPLRRLFRCRCLVTLNTDNPEMFQTQLVARIPTGARCYWASASDELRQLGGELDSGIMVPAERSVSAKLL